MSTCSIKTCKNDSRKNLKNIHFFRFPKNKEVLLKWVAVCGKENVNVKNGMYEIKYILLTKYILNFKIL